MITATIPPLARADYVLVTERWAEVVRVFTQWLHRKLKAVDACPWVLGCTEVQERRMAREGGLPLHIHLVVQARKGKEYIFAVGQIRDAWKRAVCSVCGVGDSCDFSASTRIERVKKSVTSYLSKYISKGVSEDARRATEQGFKLPSSWWIGVGKFKEAIARLMVYDTGETATAVWYMSQLKPYLMSYSFPILIGTDGHEHCIGVAGKMPRWMQRLVSEKRVNELMLVIDA